jgi:hemoglobin
VIVEYLRYRVPPDRAAAFEAAHAEAGVVLARSPHCVDYELARAVDEPGCYILRITWTSPDDHLRGFRGGELFGPFLAAVRPYIGDIEEMRHYEVTPTRGPGASVPSLHEWAGGDAALTALTAAFYVKVLADDVLAPVFAGMDPDHAQHVATWLGEVFGGPDRYTTEHGGYPHMLRRHLGRAITEAQRRRWVALLHDAADEVGLPADPEFRAAFAGYLEWGTRLAVENSRAGASPVPNAPVPRWGWGVAPPYTG